MNYDDGLYLYCIYCCYGHILLLFAVSVFCGKRIRKNKLVPLVEVCILAVLDLVIAFTLHGYIHFKFMAVIVVTSIIMTFMFRIRYLKALGLSIFFSSIDAMAEYTVAVIFGKVYFQIMGMTFEPSDVFMLCILSLISKMVLLGIVLSVKKIFGKKIPEDSNRQGMAGFIFYLTYHCIFACSNGGENGSVP